MTDKLHRKTAGYLLRRWGVVMLVAALAATMIVSMPLIAQEKPAAPPKADPKAGDKKGDKKDEKKPTAEDDAHRLLAERERMRGPTFPGKDAAFLVLPRATERSTMALDLLGSENPKSRIRTMTDRALGYLANAQDSDGGWSDNQFPSNTGVTALCCLAFMAEGSRPRVGKYGKQIDRGIEFILKNVQTSGVIAGKGSNKYGPMYEHAYSMLALLYAYGDMPWRPQTRDVISRGIQAIARSQRLDGGWRYQFSREGDADMSVTANVLWVLRTAKKSGFTVSGAAVLKGVSYIEKCALPDGTFRYRIWGLHSSPSLGGTGIIALSNEGRIDHPLITPARERIAYDYRRYTLQDLKERRYYVYGCFYASLAMYMCGDTYWVPWYRKATAVLRTMQDDPKTPGKDGELYDEHGNTVYPTAMTAIVLQAPKGYLPLFER
jgi:hypothetical protein